MERPRRNGPEAPPVRADGRSGQGGTAVSTRKLIAVIGRKFCFSKSLWSTISEQGPHENADPGWLISGLEADLVRELFEPLDPVVGRPL